MVPITEATQPGQPGYTLPDFESRLRDICQEHHDEGRAMMFAIILHDETNPAIRKVLQDGEYWEALNAIAERLITVSLPAILFFQATSDSIVGHWLIGLPEGTIEETYQALRMVIKAAADSVSKVTPDNSGNYEEIFNLVIGALKGQRTKALVLRVLKLTLDPRQFITLLS